MNIDWAKCVAVHCDKSDVSRIEDGYMWVVQEAKWNVENQRGEVILRKATYDDI